MRHGTWARWIAVALACSLLPLGNVVAQTVNHGNVEFSVLNGVAFVSRDGEDATVLMTPVPPVWRLSFWSPSSVTIDFGLSALRASEDEESFSILNLEGGVGVNLAPHNSKTVPFVGGMAGLISLGEEDDTETKEYIGGQAGIRWFVRDYAAIRAQAAYRSIFVEGDNVGIVELVGGLSFFL